MLKIGYLWIVVHLLLIKQEYKFSLAGLRTISSRYFDILTTEEKSVIFFSHFVLHYMGNHVVRLGQVKFASPRIQIR